MPAAIDAVATLVTPPLALPPGPTRLTNSDTTLSNEGASSHGRCRHDRAEIAAVV